MTPFGAATRGTVGAAPRGGIFSEVPVFSKKTSNNNRMHVTRIHRISINFY
jgi:hypothetical protein